MPHFVIDNMRRKHSPKSIKLLGKRYTFKRVPYLGPYRGDCDHPESPNKSIRVLLGLYDEEELEVTLHEILHALAWEKDEKWVEQSAIDMARVLWRLGWRKDSNQSK